MYLCFFFCKKINVEAREFSLTPTFIIEPKCDELDHVLKTNKINNINDEALMIGDTKYDVIGVKNFN